MRVGPAEVWQLTDSPNSPCRPAVGTEKASFGLLAYLTGGRTPLCGKTEDRGRSHHTLLRRLCFEEGEKAVRGPGETNVLQKLRDIYLNIDRCLDIGDLRGFSRASQELREVVARLRDHIDNASVADITSRGTPVRGL